MNEKCSFTVAFWPKSIRSRGERQYKSTTGEKEEHEEGEGEGGGVEKGGIFEGYVRSSFAAALSVAANEDREGAHSSSVEH